MAVAGHGSAVGARFVAADRGHHQREFPEVVLRGILAEMVGVEPIGSLHGVENTGSDSRPRELRHAPPVVPRPVLAPMGSPDRIGRAWFLAITGRASSFERNNQKTTRFRHKRTANDPPVYPTGQSPSPSSSMIGRRTDATSPERPTISPKGNRRPSSPSTIQTKLALPRR
jgi:hypothetical protein